MKKLIIMCSIIIGTTTNVLANNYAGMTCSQLLDEYSEIEVNGTGEEAEAVCVQIRQKIKKDKKCLKLAKEAFSGNIEQYCPKESN